MKTLANIRRKRALTAYNKAFEKYKKWSDMHINMIQTKLKMIDEAGVDAAMAYENENSWIKEKMDKAYQKLQNKKEKFYRIRSF